MIDAIEPSKFSHHLRQFDRASLFAFALIVTTVNGLTIKISSAIMESGLLGAALGLFGVSAIVWLALAAIYKIASDNDHQIRQAAFDLPVVILMMIAAFLPVGMEASLALFGGSLYLFSTSAQGSCERRLSIVGLALTGYILWGPVFLNFLGPELVEIDAALVSTFSGLPRDANMVDFVGADHMNMVISPGCSSVYNVSLAIILFAAATQLFNLKITSRLVIFCALAIFATVAVNIFRLIVIANYPDHFESLHHGSLSPIFGWMSLLAIVLIVTAGILNETKRAV